MRDCFCGDDNREYTCRYCITSKLRQNPTPTENISNADDSSPTLSASAGTFRHGRQSYTINEAAERHASMPARVLSQSLISNGAALQSARYSINASAARSASATQRSRPGFPSRTPRAHQAPSNVDVVPELSITFQTAQGTRTQLVDEIGLPLSIEYKVHELIKHTANKLINDCLITTMRQLQHLLESWMDDAGVKVECKTDFKVLAAMALGKDLTPTIPLLKKASLPQLLSEVFKPFEQKKPYEYRMVLIQFKCEEKPKEPLSSREAEASDDASRSNEATIRSQSVAESFASLELRQRKEEDEYEQYQRELEAVPEDDPLPNAQPPLRAEEQPEEPITIADDSSITSFNSLSTIYRRHLGYKRPRRPIEPSNGEGPRNSMEPPAALVPVVSQKGGVSTVEEPKLPHISNDESAGVVTRSRTHKRDLSAVQEQNVKKKSRKADH